MIHTMRLAEEPFGWVKEGKMVIEKGFLMKREEKLKSVMS